MAGCIIFKFIILKLRTSHDDGGVSVWVVEVRVVDHGPQDLPRPDSATFRIRHQQHVIRPELSLHENRNREIFLLQVYLHIGT